MRAGGTEGKRRKARTAVDLDDELDKSLEDGCKNAEVAANEILRQSISKDIAGINGRLGVIRNLARARPMGTNGEADRQGNVQEDGVGPVNWPPDLCHTKPQ